MAQCHNCTSIYLSIEDTGAQTCKHVAAKHSHADVPSANENTCDLHGHNEIYIHSGHA